MNSERIALLGVIATLLGVVVTWLVARRQFSSKKLAYTYAIEEIVKSDDPDLSYDLKVFYKGDELPEPTLLSFNLTNVGYSSVEDVEIIIQLPGTTYLLPGYFVDVAPGYDRLWDIVSTDAEECTLKLKHINPRQTVKARLLMDERPKGEPRISCPMPNVECRKASFANLSKTAEIGLSIFAPQLSSILNKR